MRTCCAGSTRSWILSSRTRISYATCSIIILIACTVRTCDTRSIWSWILTGRTIRNRRWCLSSLGRLLRPGASVSGANPCATALRTSSLGHSLGPGTVVNSVIPSTATLGASSLIQGLRRRRCLICGRGLRYRLTRKSVPPLAIRTCSRSTTRIAGRSGRVPYTSHCTTTC